jgi:hypothetical protein
MNNDTNQLKLPSLVDGFIANSKQCIDNVFADNWKTLKISKYLYQSGFKKRSGCSVESAVYLLLMWKWLAKSSIAMFSRDSLDHFYNVKKDVIYETLKRPDLNWRQLQYKLAKEVYKSRNIKTHTLSAFVFDDTVKIRRGKKMEGVSSHFDHTLSKHVMGQQMLTMGLSTEELFMPLDSQLYISKTKISPLNREYKDNRCIAAKRYNEALHNTKPEMADEMIRRAKNYGINADYVIADAWFGTKPMIYNITSHNLTAVLRMKKNKMKYRYTDINGEHLLINAQDLYQYAVRKQWEKIPGVPYQAVNLNVELDFSEFNDGDPLWFNIQLLFTRGVSIDGGSCGKKDWALFLVSNPLDLTANQILEIYALRWSIEVYFKEAKQHLGLLQEQTRSFASYTASIHLTGIRYLILINACSVSNDLCAGNIRSAIQEQMNALDFAKKLWSIFRFIITGAIEKFRDKLGDQVELINDEIEKKVESFFIKSLQLDEMTLRLEFESA